MRNATVTRLLFLYHRMAKLIPFPARRLLRTSALVLNLAASWEITNKPDTWPNRPVPPERLGNMLQRLARKRPAAVLVLENLVADMLEQIDR